MGTSDTNYLFIDAGYLRRVITDVLEPFVGQTVEVNWFALKVKCSSQRVFYYDCVDEIKRDNEIQEQYEARLKTQQENIDYIKEQDSYHVRLGTITA